MLSVVEHHCDNLSPNITLEPDHWNYAKVAKTVISASAFSSSRFLGCCEAVSVLVGGEKSS